MVFGIVTTSALASDFDSNILVEVNGKQVVFNQPPYMPNANISGLMVPYKPLVDALGCTVQLFPAEWRNSIVVHRGSVEVRIPIDGQSIFKNGESINATPSFEINNTYYIPLKVVVEALECTFNWNADKKLVSITYSGVPKSTPVVIKKNFPDESDYRSIQQAFITTFKCQDEIRFQIREDQNGRRWLQGAMKLDDYREPYYNTYMYVIGGTWGVIGISDTGIISTPEFLSHDPMGVTTITSRGFYFQLSKSETTRVQLGNNINNLRESLAVIEVAKTFVENYIKPEMTDREKIKATHDFIILNCAYDYINFINDTIPEVSYTAYGALVLNKAVCGGYARAFAFLMDYIGLDCVYIGGQVWEDGQLPCEGDEHAWNLVNVDGKWLHIDLTWNDPDREVMTNRINYDYYLITDNQMDRLRNCEALAMSFDGTNIHEYSGISDDFLKLVEYYSWHYAPSIVN